ncbi:uncharacterized protein [Pyrus communis]|uniref:uncharacterized protein n=1 Tax=Pyrus communis TaxID=23211 RepID=UPI0035C1B4B7
MVYGYPSPHLVSYEVGKAKLEVVEQGLLARNKLLSMLKSNLVVTQNRMKLQADKHKSEREFEVGDWVYLKLVPYQLQFLASHSYHKLHPKYYRPFEVKERIGLVAYRIQLPDSWRIYSVFHVSCLKKCLGKKAALILVLPQVIEDGMVHADPVAMLQRRMYKKGNVAVVQLLIQ